MSWQARQESKRVKREKTVVWRWLLRKSLTRNLRIQTEFVPDIVSEKVIISQQRAIVWDQVVLIKTCHYWIYLILQHNSTETSCCEHFKWVKIEKIVSHLISNKVPPANLFSNPASEWFSRKAFWKYPNPSFVWLKTKMMKSYIVKDKLYSRYTCLCRSQSCFILLLLENLLKIPKSFIFIIENKNNESYEDIKNKKIKIYMFLFCPSQ